VLAAQRISGRVTQGCRVKDSRSAKQIFAILNVDMAHLVKQANQVG
jgi:hypothetical protein